MGKVQSTLLTITAVVWTSNAACQGGAANGVLEGTEQCDPAVANVCCDTATCTIIPLNLALVCENPANFPEYQALMGAWIAHAISEQAAASLIDAKAADTIQTTTLQTEMAVQEATLKGDIALAKKDAIIEAIAHKDNYNQDNHDDFKQQLNVAMQANLNAAKTEADKAEKSADEAYKSAKDAAISALESKQSAEHAKKNKADADDILTSVKKLVQGWIHTNYGGCAQPPCSSPCQYSAINPLYYYHC